MRLSRVRQQALERRARRLGSVVRRGTELVGGYAGGVAVVASEPIPLWGVVVGATAGFLLLLSYLTMMLRRTAGADESGIREWSSTLLERVPGWLRLDDVALRGSDADHVIAAPIGLIVVLTKWRAGMGDGQARRHRHEHDLSLAAQAARRVRRVTSLPPNALDVPVHAALLLWGPGNDAVTFGWNEAMGVYVLDANQPWGWPAELTEQSATAGQASCDFGCRPADVDEALRKVRGWAANYRRSLSARRLAAILLAEVRHGMGSRRRARRVVRA